MTSRSVKSVCREHLHRAGTFVQLIGEDTARKHKYVRCGGRGCYREGVPHHRSQSRSLVGCEPGDVSAYASQRWRDVRIVLASNRRVCAQEFCASNL